MQSQHMSSATTQYSFPKYDHDKSFTKMKPCQQIMTWGRRLGHMEGDDQNTIKISQPC